MSNDPLLQPYTLKHLTLKNRILSTSHEPNYAEDGLPTERYRLYHREKARGGIALNMIAGSAIVAEDSPAAFGNLQVFRDEVVPHLRRLTEDCHEHNCKVMIQLTHLGWRTNWNHSDWLPVISASRVREPAHRAFPKEMEDWDIARVIQRFADATERMKEAGLDGVELYASGHLVDNFWSPKTNQREDAYGGSLENRMRFATEMIDAVRDRVGPDYVIGMRLVIDEDLPGGLGAEEGAEISRRLAATGKLDFLNVNRGTPMTDNLMADLIPLQGSPASPHLEAAGRIKSQVDIPIFHAARINDVATARHAVASGKVDLVGMTRAHIADPHIVRKITEGREDQIRPCTGATYCLGRIYEANEALCIHNAATGREAFMPHAIPSADDTKKVVIVGAGPAGLEAARVSAERGHKVTLFEAQDQPGGQIRLITRTRRRAEMLGIIDWRMAELERLGVATHFNAFADADDIRVEAPDIVVVATGGVPDTGVCQGSNLATTTWEVISGEVKPTGEVLVYDDHGQEQAMQAIETLAEAGASVEAITPDRMLGPDVSGINHAPYGRCISKHGVRVTVNTQLRGISDQGNRLVATLGSEYSDRAETRLVDHVVIEHGTLPVDDLYFALKPLSRNLGEVDHHALINGQPQRISTNPDGAFQLFRIGDAVASRNIHAAIYDGLRYAKDF